MSTSREIAKAENQILIQAALEVNPLIVASVEAGNVIQTELGSIGLGDKTKAAQQELSDRFGIPTFDIEGNISTLPISGIIDETINVGTGKFSESAFKASIENLLGNQTQQFDALGSLNDIFVRPIQDFFNDIFNIVPDIALPPEQRERVAQLEEFNRFIDGLLAQNDTRVLQNHLREIIDRGIALKLSGSMFQRLVVSQLPSAVRSWRFSAQNKIDEIKKKFSALERSELAAVALASDLNKLITTSPFTLGVKTELLSKIKEASEFIKLLLERRIEVDRQILTELQVSMQKAAFKMSEKIQEEQGVIDVILDFGEGVLGGLTKGLSIAFTIFSEAFTNIMNELFDISPEKLAEAQELTTAFAEAQAQEAEK